MLIGHTGLVILKWTLNWYDIRRRLVRISSLLSLKGLINKRPAGSHIKIWYVLLCDVTHFCFWNDNKRTNLTDDFITDFPVPCMFDHLNLTGYLPHKFQGSGTWYSKLSVFFNFNLLYHRQIRFILIYLLCKHFCFVLRTIKSII